MPLNFTHVADRVALAAEHQMAGRFTDAETLYVEALQLNPADVRALRGMGMLAFQLGRLLVAEQFLRRALDLENDPATWTNLGDVYATLGRGDPALASYERACQAHADYLPAMNNAAVVLFLSGNNHRAAELWSRIVDVATARGDPASLELAGNACNNLGEARLQAADTEEACRRHRAASQMLPQHPGVASNYVRDLSYVAGIDPQQVRREADAWWPAFTAGISPLVVRRDKNPERPLRVGFVSPDFREHAVTHFLLPLFEHHDRDRWEFTAYAAGSREDAFTARLSGLVERWRKISAASDAAVAQQVDADQIDILIDLAGHTGENRLRIFAYQAAPLQGTFLGYPSTVGVSAIAFRLTDAVADPPGPTDSQFSERLVRLPRCAWCYRSPVDLPPVPPRDLHRPLTFGSFNAVAKMSPVTLQLWAAVLKATPGSRLFLKAAALHEQVGQTALTDRFAALGIGPERLLLMGRQATLSEHAAKYAEVDVALDTFPYHGTTTTCEALWMGVPVVTLAGNTHVSRVGASLLQAVGLPELVAQDEAGYVAAALRAVGGPRGAALRTQMQASPLRDESGYTRAVEAALRNLWREYCAI